MKTYTLMISRYSPKGHKKENENTYFPEKILYGQGYKWPKNYDFRPIIDIMSKIHTIRQNYPLWLQRIKEVQAGRAELSLRYWSGKPYRSKQVEFLRLGKEDGVGIESLEETFLGWYIDKYESDYNTEDIAKNDGLNKSDFVNWFESEIVKMKTMAIIHFTSFRYSSMYEF